MADLLKSKLGLFCTLLAFIVFFDQITKSVFASTCNRGVAFGLLDSFGVINLVVSVLILSVFIYFLVRQKRIILFFASSLIVSGGLSNLVDRLAFGCVRDFIDFQIWPSYNIADSVIFAGVVIHVVKSLFVKNGTRN